MGTMEAIMDISCGRWHPKARNLPWGWFQSQPKMMMSWGIVYEKLGESHIIHWDF
jgi:hypothetical protein